MRLQNGLIFQNRQEDRYPSEEIINDLLKFVESEDELTAVILENGQLKAIHDSTLWYGFYGLNVALFIQEWREKLLELKQYEREKVTGRFIDGKLITITRYYSSHRFTDKECEELFAGRVITITFTTSYGNTRTVQGKIEKKDWPEKEIEFYGFVTHDLEQENKFCEGIYKGQLIKFKNSFADHTYTDEEIEKLLNGRIIYVKFTNKNGKRVAARLKLVQEDGNFYKVAADFNVPPVKFSGREFTEEEIERLHYGYSISGSFTNKSGNWYTAEIRWNNNKIERNTKNGWQ